MLSTHRRLVDVAIIGAGTAGLASYHEAAEVASRVVLIEYGPPGTTCARVACMPSKLLVAAAEVAHNARHTARFGIGCSVQVDGRAVMERVHRERDRFVELIVADVAHIPEEDRILGRARFTAPGVLEVDGRETEARAVVIAAGSTPFVDAKFESVGDRLVVNDDVFAWTTLPESVAVSPITRTRGSRRTRRCCRVASTTETRRESPGACLQETSSGCKRAEASGTAAPWFRAKGSGVTSSGSRCPRHSSTTNPRSVSTWRRARSRPTVACAARSPW
jgi:Pyridine nucleotide-disulphide oxidoreductase